MEDYNNWTTEELFYKLLDSLYIDVDSDYEYWKWYRLDMIQMLKELNLTNYE